MEQIKLNKEDIEFLRMEYPELDYNEAYNTINGNLGFCRSYHEKKIRGKYAIQFKLEHGDNSILPKVRETKGKILNIAKRKNKSWADVHLNSDDGELCLIFPLKEKEFYPNGFKLKRFLNHLEEHFYWITYFDRYNEKPWEDEPHNGIEALVKAAKENKVYRKDLKATLESLVYRKLTRSEFRRYLKENKLL